SRRRHTRWPRDWSSDVCSSDLNYPPDSVPIPDDGMWLDTRNQQGGISLVPPPNLAARLQRLPPILHSQTLVSLSSCSKGSRGLSVFPRVNCIGTAISISLSPSPRQCGSRYSIRAGRNLPDKEFRYLRTVIVTAAVYWGFGSSLRLAADESP